MTELHETKAPQYLSFAVGPSRFGLPILAVKEILQHEPPTPVPGTPPSIRGVINVRGQAIPVVDLAVRFRTGETRASGRACILVVEVRLLGEPLVLGVLADAVHEVLDLPEGEIAPSPSLGPEVRLDYLAGMGKVGKGFVLLLDVDRALPPALLLAAAAAAQGAGQPAA